MNGRWHDPEVDDRALLTAHVEGDREAFGVLFARHRDRLWAVAVRTTGDPEEAADALQDGMVSAFRRAGSYRGDAAVSTWLHRIVVNACLDRLRRRKVRLADPLPDDLDRDTSRGPVLPGGTAPAAQPDPVQSVLDEEQRSAVLRALDTLPVEQRAALVLVDMQGYSVEEAAGILDCAPGTVKSRCSRGRARLLPLLTALRDGNLADAGRVQPGSPTPAPDAAPAQATSARDVPPHDAPPHGQESADSTEEVTNT